VKLVRWVLLAIVMAALGGFVAELLRPRHRPAVGPAAGSGYVPPAPSLDRYVVLPRDR
jgi:hypothetical protein